jgi:hypothetical protein
MLFILLKGYLNSLLPGISMHNYRKEENITLWFGTAKSEKTQLP